MNKIIFLLIAGISINALQAQESRDAIRYSQENLNGTARLEL